jgi:hypothetical protein
MTLTETEPNSLVSRRIDDDGLNVKKFCTLGLVANYVLVHYEITELLQRLRSVEYCEIDRGLHEDRI